MTTDQSVGDLALRFVLNGGQVVLKFYITCLLIAYKWGVRLLESACKPFAPVAEEVRKVPKKDVSAEGIFYQFLRLQFLAIMYVSPFVISAARFVAQPLVRLKEWMEDYVGWEDRKYSQD